MKTRPPGKPIIRLLAVAGECSDMLTALDCDGAKSLISLVQSAVGDRYRVTGSAAQIEAREDDRHGGRTDDAARAREIQSTLADERVVAAVALRGGAWLTRILPRIDFGVLQKRSKRIALFGFSELTPLINIAARYNKVFAYYDLCPGFLLAGMTRYARDHLAELTKGVTPGSKRAKLFSRRWAGARFRSEFSLFFRDATAMIEGRGSSRCLTGTCVRGKLAATQRIAVVGGNLTTLTTLLGSPYAAALRPRRRWLAIEDVNESPERIDRLLSHLSLSGWLQRYDGFLLGRFLDRKGDCTDAVLRCLDRHLDVRHRPVIVAPNFGHVWPLAPIPLNRPFELQAHRRRGRTEATFRFAWSKWAIL